MPQQQRTCSKCGEPLKYSRKTKQWYCPQCLLSAWLTDQAQKEAVRRYRQSPKGTEAAQRYEQSEKGKSAREKYLKSPKYKLRRKEYNERLKESLRIAREVIGPRGARKDTPEEARQFELLPIKNDIREFKTMAGHLPPIEDVKEWAEEYNITMSDVEAQKLLQES